MKLFLYPCVLFAVDELAVLEARVIRIVDRDTLVVLTRNNKILKAGLAWPFKKYNRSRKLASL